MTGPVTLADLIEADKLLWVYCRSCGHERDVTPAKVPLDVRPVFAFPGVWTRYKGPLKKNGETVDQEVFAFMTTDPNELTASINHERMPVLLTDPGDFETWLSGSTEEAFKLARSYAADQMRIVQSGSERQDLLGAA